MICANSTPSAWVVVAPDGFRSLFLVRSRAEHWAVSCHGVIRPLYESIDPNPATPPEVPAP